MLDKIIRPDKSNEITSGEEVDILKTKGMQFIKMWSYFIIPLGALHHLLFAIVSAIFVGTDKVKFLFIYFASKALCFVSYPQYQISKGISARKMASILSGGVIPTLLSLTAIWLVTGAVYFLAIPISRKLKKKAEERVEKKHIRGGELISADKVLVMQKERGMDGTIPLGVVDDIPDYTVVSYEEYNQRYYPRTLRVEKRRETDGILICGTKGSGKGLFITPIIAQCYQEGARGIIYDFKGDEYFCRFFNSEKDILLNFCDVRGEQFSWNFFLEMETVMEASAIAYSLVPPMEKVEPFWINAPRDILEGLILYCFANDKKTYAELWEIITAPATKIQHVLNATPGAEKGRRYLEDPESKMCGSVLSVLVQQCTCFSLMSDKPSKSFNLTDWIKGGEGFIYLTSEDSLEATLRGFYTLFIDTVVRKTLSAGGDLNRRIWMFLDEFSTLNQCSIPKALNQGRSTGLVLLLGLQSLSQLEQRYGKHDKEALIAGCGIKMIFRLGDNSSSKYIEELIGDVEEMQSEKNFQMKTEDKGDGTGLANRKKVEKLLMASQLTNMPNLHAIVSHPGLPLTMTTFPIVSIPNNPNVPKLILRDDLLLANKYKKPDISAHNSDDVPIEIEAEHVEPVSQQPEVKVVEPEKTALKREKELDKDRDRDYLQYT